MVRIIPWNLPPVNGGSIGGYTPKVEPTPEPTPVPYNYPYILDNMVVVDPTIEVNHGSSRKGDKPAGSSNTDYYRWYQTEGNKITIGVSGVEIVDTQNVSSVIAKVNVSGSLVQSYCICTPSNGIVASAQTKTDSDLNVNVNIDITTIMTPLGGSATNVCNVGGTFETYLGYIKNANAPTGAYYSAQSTGANATITTAPTLTLVSITAYNSNGVPIQEWTPPEEEEE